MGCKNCEEKAKAETAKVRSELEEVKLVSAKARADRDQFRDQNMRLVNERNHHKAEAEKIRHYAQEKFKQLEDGYRTLERRYWALFDKIHAGLPEDHKAQFIKDWSLGVRLG